MSPSTPYRDRAEQLRRLQVIVSDVGLANLIAQMAVELDETASDIEDRAVEIRHIDKLSPRQRDELAIAIGVDSP